MPTAKSFLMENRWLAEIQIPKSKTKKMESYEGEDHIYTTFCFTGVCHESPWEGPIQTSWRGV
jgi:hypothetical protein